GLGGVVTLSGTNTYSGPTQVSNAGILSVPAVTNGGVAGPLGAAANSPGNLVLGGVAYLGSNFSYSGGGGTLRYTGPTAATDRGLTLPEAFSPSTVEVTTAATNLTIAGKLTGPGGLVKAGAGAL